MDATAIGIVVANNFFRNGVDSERSSSRISGLSPKPKQQQQTLVNV